MARRKIPNRHDCEVEKPGWGPPLKYTSPEEAAKIKGVTDYREYLDKYEGDDMRLGLLHALARCHPTKVRLSPTDMVFYGSSDKHDSSIAKGVPDILKYGPDFGTRKCYLSGTVITPPQGDELGRHMMKVNDNGQGDGLVAAVLRTIPMNRAVEAVCDLDEWFGVAHWQEGSPFERREVKLVDRDAPHHTAWAWVMKEDSEAPH